MADDKKPQPEDTPTLKDKNKVGPPSFSDQQFVIWLEDMRPFLRQGMSLNYSIDKAGLTNHRTAIYDKARLKDWFNEQISRLQATITDLNNSAIFKIVDRVHARLAENSSAGIDPQEAKIMALVAEKHRTSQPFWVTRNETADAKDEDFGKIIETPTIEYVIPKEEGKKDETESTDQPTESQVQSDSEAASGVEETDGSDNE